jgi:putative ABC transport system permease protein
MFKNYLKVAFRNILRNKTYSFINIFGFALGLAVCLIITFYVIDDLTFDKFHEDAEYIYHMLTIDSSESDGALHYSITSGPLIADLAESVPEVEAATRITAGGVGLNRINEGVENEQTEQVNVLALFADSSFFDVFSFKIIARESKKPLKSRSGIYLTPEIAETLFGNENPIGKPLAIRTDENAYVAGIVEAPPSNSFLQFQIIAPLRIDLNPVWWDSWENLALIGYFKIHKNADPLKAEKNIVSYAKNRGFAEVFTPRIQPLLDVHLGSNHLRYDYINFGKNDRLKVFTLGIIAILVLIIASINFINLSSARAAKRAREVGMRKVIGGNRKQLFFQFLGESIVITCIAMIIALALFEIALPHLNTFLNKNLSFNLIENYEITLIIFCVAIIVGLIAGIYPALVLSGFDPLTVLRGKFYSSTKGIVLRRILVVGQFVVSIALIASVFIVLDQINYLNKVDLGYNRDRIIVFPNFNFQNGTVLKEQIQNLSAVESVGVVSNMPGGTLVRLEVIPEGYMEDEGQMFDRLFIDENLINTLEIELLQGRNFSSEFASDAEDAIIINETALKTIGWDDPIGKKLILIDETEIRLVKTIIGVIKDINFTTARRKVNPMVLGYSNQFIPRFLVKLKPGDNTRTIEEIEKLFIEVYPDTPFNYFYFDDVFNFQFRGDRNFATNIAVFSGLAILIACLGLFGLVSFATQQRQREIAVRKVLGSSVKSIVFLLTKNFTIWVLSANILAWPLSYFLMNKWLQNFAYRTNINVWIFVVSGFIALGIALITVSFQTIKAANLNPVDALKYE